VKILDELEKLLYHIFLPRLLLRSRFYKYIERKVFSAEIIRQVLFNKLSQELPYSTEVQIEEFKERQKGKWFINASIICERPTQKTNHNWNAMEK